MAIGKVTHSAPNEITEPNNDVFRLDISKLSVTLTESPKPILPPEVIGLRFGTTFTDHMAVATYDPSTGWSNPEIKPYAPLTLDPSSSCLQISSSVLEGMKAYLGPDGKARLFRPELNMRRLERSAARLALPPVDGDGTLELIKRLVETEKRWIPTLQGYSTGGNKVCGNYSPGLAPQRAAAKQGYDQVLWLFGEEKRVTEAGVMHFCVVVTRDDGNGESFDGLRGRYVGQGINLVEGCDFITAPLDGMIIHGVTRASCLALVSDPAFNEAAGLNLHPVERTYTMQDLVQWSSQGKLMEALCIGTAAIVVAVNKIGYEGRDVEVPAHEAGLGPAGMALREKILAIQEGREEYKGWSVVCE
ncbi:branched-chain amino acid aminotransferase II [Paxillus ammoniavirescens]|nr:branched-chain amino acid aminotransferase II [Paxillus ammoniavirescens]